VKQRVGFAAATETLSLFDLTMTVLAAPLVRRIGSGDAKPRRNPPLPAGIAVKGRTCCEITGRESSNDNEWLRKKLASSTSFSGETLFDFVGS
jgi:hypothetical protein